MEDAKGLSDQGQAGILYLYFSVVWYFSGLGKHCREKEGQTERERERGESERG